LLVIVASLHDEGILWMSFNKGKSLSAYLATISPREQMNALEKGVYINATITNNGIISESENRQEKTHKDLANLEILTENQYVLLNENIDVTVKYSTHFPSVYDRDGHGDNILVDGRMYVVIDHESRKASDPMYQLVKLIEHKGILSYDDAGLEARKRLIHQHLAHLGIEGRGEKAEVHYFMSTILKAVSAFGVSQNRSERGQIHQGYIEGALFGTYVLLNKYRHHLSGSEIDRLHKVNYVLQEVKEQHIPYITH
jgi:hypothetical protein